MSRVGIVCDSTSDLEPAWYDLHDVAMVPLKVLFGDETFLDWVDFAPAEFYERLTAAAQLPKTSQPSPAEFAAAYARLAEAGCDQIVSIHLTAALSGTFESATMAAKDAAIPVHVIDTKTVSQATALVVKAAVEARDAGADAAEIVRVAQQVTDDVSLFFVLDTLEYLVKGGRAGKAQGLAASVLNIKPILTFNSDGIIEPFKKVKGTRKAIAELARHMAADALANGRLRVSTLSACAPEFAEELRAALDTAGVDYEFESVGLIGSVIGTYAGPRAVGCAYYHIR
ncbi:MAG: DegV family protein [Actinobacteria bacterium]|nr:DegV family protein [Actinomycetota bacterium]MCG2807501.1 DegV family protein [Coriobacteriia bacterium]